MHRAMKGIARKLLDPEWVMDVARGVYADDGNKVDRATAVARTPEQCRAFIRQWGAGNRSGRHEALLVLQRSSCAVPARGT